MHPTLFVWGPMTVYTYGVLVALGVILALWYARHIAPRAGLDPDRIWNLGIYMVLAGLVSAKLWSVVQYWEFYSGHPREILSLSTLQTGGTFYGGLAGAVLTLALYTHFRRMPFLSAADMFAVAGPLGHAIGRAGCFAAGCCWGKATWLPVGVTFHDPAAAALVGTPLGVPLHPTQLYEGFAELANFALLVWLARSRRFNGQLFALYLMLYGLERGLIEFVRGDPDRTLFLQGRMSLMQVISLALILLGAWLWSRVRQHPAAAPVHAGAAGKH